MRTCKKCSTEKPDAEFQGRRGRICGRCNQDRINAWGRQSDSVRKYRKQYREDKAAYFAAKTAERRAREGVASFGDKQEIAKLYGLCDVISKASGVPHNVDHIVPLFGKNVSGLHAHWNMQVITADANRRKSNH